MADEKLSQQPVAVAMVDTDVMLVNKDQGGSIFATEQLTWASVKSELAAQLAIGASDKIEEGDSSVEVIDTGTDGKINFTSDGTEMARMDSGNTWLSKAGGPALIFSTAPGSFDLMQIDIGDAPNELRISDSVGSGPVFSVQDEGVGIKVNGFDVDARFHVADASSNKNQLTYFVTDDEFITLARLENLGASKIWDINHLDDGTLVFRSDPTGFQADVLQLLHFAGAGVPAVYLYAPSSQPSSPSLGNSQMTFWLDEGANDLKVEVQYSTGTTKTATIPLV
jgi:hypothetical protein